MVIERNVVLGKKGDLKSSCNLASLVCGYDADVRNVLVYFPSSYKVRVHCVRDGSGMLD